MAQYHPIQIRYNPVRTYPGTTQNNYVGAQSTAGQRGTLPAAAVPATFDDSQAYYISKSGKDNNAGTHELPKLTLGSLFSTTVSQGNDTSGNGNNATMTGTIPTMVWPTVSTRLFASASSVQTMVPPTGTTIAGPFSDSNYLKAPSAVLSGISGKTTLTVEGYFLVTQLGSTSDMNMIQAYTGSTTPFRVYIAGTTNYFSFLLNNGGTILATTAPPALGQWYYFACVHNSGVSNGTQIWLGSSPETATVVASTTVTYTTGTSTSLYIGRSPNSGFSYNEGYLCRVGISNTARTSFPVAPGASGLLGLYTFATAPLIQSAPRNYVVIQDSGTYNDPLFLNFRYDIINAFGIYAADGQTPTIQYQKGAIQGTFGVNNSARILPTTSPDKHVSKSGSDSGSTGPFLTITYALTHITTGQCIQVDDSGTYQADYALPSFPCTIQAATGQTPVLRASKHSTAARQFTAGNASAYVISGFILDGGDSQGALCGAATTPVAATFTFLDCTIRNYAALQTSTNEILGNWTRCFIVQVPTVNAANGGGATLTFTNTYYANSANSAAAIKVNLGSASINSQQSTFVNCAMTVTNNNGSSIQPMVLNNSLFNNSSLTYSNSVNSNTPDFSLTNSVFSNGYVSFSASAAYCVAAFNILQMGYSGIAQAFYTTIPTCFLENFTAIGNTNNFVLNAGSAVVFAKNCSSINGGTAGYSGAATAQLLYCLDAGSASALAGSGPPTATNFFSNTAVLSQALGNENIGLTPSSPALFGGPNNVQDGGYDWALWYLNLGVTVTVNGISFNSPTYPGFNSMVDTNQESGILFSGPGTLNVKYCTFSNLGPYAINAPAGATIQYNYFNVNGTAVKTAASNVTLSNNVGWECGGAFIVNQGTGATIQNNSAWGCDYGAYESLWSTAAVDKANVYGGSATYDYSGNQILAYSDVQVVDPACTGGLDATCVQGDPMFRNVAGGDLRLQSVATGFPYNSPAVLSAPPLTADMGAFSMTYTAQSLSWSTLTLTYNPDQVDRVQAVIKLAEGDTEGGNLYSTARAFQNEYHFIWNENNPMPAAQLAGLTAVYTTGLGECQLSFDNGGTWVPVRVVRSNDFEWQDLDMMYNDSLKPTPVREIHFRESA